MSLRIAGLPSLRGAGSARAAWAPLGPLHFKCLLPRGPRIPFFSGPWTPFPHPHPHTSTLGLQPPWDHFHLRPPTPCWWSLSTSRHDPWPLSPLELLKPFHLGATGICDPRLPGLPSTLELPTLFPLGTAVPRAPKPHILKPAVFGPRTQVSSGTLLSGAHTPLCAGETRESRLGDPSLQLDGGAEAGVCVRGC